MQTYGYMKKSARLERHSKGQFCKNTVYLERGIPYFAFVAQMQCLSRKTDRLSGIPKSLPQWGKVAAEG